MLEMFENVGESMVEGLLGHICLVKLFETCTNLGPKCMCEVGCKLLCGNGHVNYFFSYSYSAERSHRLLGHSFTEFLKGHSELLLHDGSVPFSDDVFWIGLTNAPPKKRASASSPKKKMVKHQHSMKIIQDAYPSCHPP